MFVSEISIAKAVPVQSDMPAVKAYKKIENVDHTKFPVVDKDGRLVGIVDKSDLADLSSSGSPFKEMRFSSILNQTKVRDVMNNNVFYCKETDTIWEAALNMKDHRVSILPVVDEDNILVSVLARKDLLMALLNYAGAKYEGLFISVEAPQPEDIFKVTEIISKTKSTLMFISQCKGKIVLKITGENTEATAKAIEDAGYKLIYRVAIN